MKLRIILKVTAVALVMLLCTGFAISLYLKMSIKERAGYFDLYSLVPPDTQLVIDAGNMVDLVQRINEMSCSKDEHVLYFSRFFSLLREHISSLLEQSPHSLNKQMSKMLISFHEPENDKNQVFYCSLGSSDFQFIEKLIQKHSSNAFPSRLFNYHGEEIRIYPMHDDLFLACYVNSEFLVLSYQKKLIEQVIDTYLSGRSILSDESFSTLRSEHRMVAHATIYTRMQFVEMGYDDVTQVHSNIGNWTEFSVNFNPNAIYLAGGNHDADSCHTFTNAIRNQKPISGFYESAFPASTFFFSNYSISDPEKLLEFTTVVDSVATDYSNSDNTLLYLLKEHAGYAMNVCMFYAGDTVSKMPYAIASIPLDHHLTHISQALRGHYPSVPRLSHIYIIPHNMLFAQLTEITNPSANSYLCLHKNSLLIAPNIESIQAYIEFIEGDRSSLEENPVYENIVSLLAPVYNFMMIADMDQMLEQSGNETRFIPNLFFRYKEFFRRFILSVQFICDEDIVYPNLILTYKGMDTATAQ